MSTLTEKKLVTFDNIQHYHDKLSQVVDGKQDSLVSGSNIKTINGEIILGEGNIEINEGNPDANIQAVDTSEILDDVSGNTYVKYVAQTLTEAQKEQARTNINALSQNNIKTINGESIVGSGDIVIGGGSDSIDPSNYYTKTEIDNKGFVEEDELSIVAKSGSYNDLSNKPTIPSAVTESTVSGWGFTKNTGTYSKPSAGIPKTDLSSDVQTSLGKADTALQSYTEQYKGTVTGVKVNGTTKNPSNGVVDLGTVITTHQTLKTINGESIVGTGDIVISGGSGDYLPLTGGTLNGDLTINEPYKLKVRSGYIGGPYTTGLFIDMYTFGLCETSNGRPYIQLTYAGDGTKFLSDDGTYKEVSGGSSSGSSAYSEVSHGTSDTTFTLTPNTFHIWDEVSYLTLTLGAETSGVANEYLFQFTSGPTATTLSLPDDIKWTGGEVPTIEANKIYQISILKGLGSVLEWDSVSLIENKLTLTDGDMMSGSVLTFAYPTASELTLTMQYYSSDTLIVPIGTTSITIDWFEPMAPQIIGINPISDSTYKYIM